MAYLCTVCGTPTIVVDHSEKDLPPTIKCDGVGACHVGTALLAVNPIPPNAVASHKTYLPQPEETSDLSDELKAHVAAGGVLVKNKRL